MPPTKKLSPADQAHADWLGMLRPEGLVVSISVLRDTNAYARQPALVQERLRAILPGALLSRAAFDQLLFDIFEWNPKRLVREVAAWTLPMAELGLILAPEAVLLDPKGNPLLLVQWSDERLDTPLPGARFPLSRQSALERLLVELQHAGKDVKIALHACPNSLRLTYAPAGEAPGSLTFPLDALVAADGRVLVDALLMLLGRSRLFDVPSEQRLGVLLSRSRREQESVTIALSGQVEQALRVLVDAFSAADLASNGELLRDWRDQPREIQGGLVAVILRLVFVLYCEDRLEGGRGLLPVETELYQQHYSVSGLAERLLRSRCATARPWPTATAPMTA